MIDILKNSSYFGLLLSLAAYMLAWYLHKKTKLAVFNPLLISIALVIGVLLATGIDYQSYYSSAKVLSYLLTPATVCLAIPMYEQLQLLRKHFWSVLVGILSGVIASMGSILAIAMICSLNHLEYATLLPKSVTTAIAMPLSEMMGGNGAITAVLVILTGVVGNLTAEGFLKLVRVKNPVAKGIAIGTSAHVCGTSRAMEIGVIEGAMSSLSVVVAGIITVVLASCMSQMV